MAVRVTNQISTTVEGYMNEVMDAKVTGVPTLEELLKTMAELAFVVETVAHLQGKEVTLLPIAEKAREQIEALQPREL